MKTPLIKMAARFAQLGLAGGLLLVTDPAQADNILVNPSFEANSGHVVAAGWTYFAPPEPPAYFGDYWVESAVPAHSGSLYWKQWGALYSPTTNNVAGIYQDFSSAPGSTYQASGWFYTHSTDILGADCYIWIEVGFYGASSNLLALYKSGNFNAAVGTDTWFQYLVTNACDISSPVSTGDPYFNTYAVTGSVSQLVAPLGTTTVRFRFAYLQYLNEGGSCYLDDAALEQVGFAPPPPLITQQPQSLTVTNGDPASFAVSASSLSPMGYHWQRNGTNLTDGGEISGSTTSTLALSTTTNNDAGAYSVIVTNLYGGATSSVAILTVLWPPTVTREPVNQTVTAGSNIMFSVTADGNPPVSYQWLFDGGNLVGDLRISGSATATLGISNVLREDAGNYAVVVSNFLGSVTSVVATLTVLTLPEALLVTNTNDSGAGSLRRAMLNADAIGGGDIGFSNVTGTITLESSLPLIQANVSIVGPGAAQLTVISTNGHPFSIVSNGVARIEGLTIIGADGTAGGGIYNCGTLVLNRCMITNSVATYSGGGIYNSGDLTLNDCSIYADYVYWGNGAGIYNSGDATLNDCSIYANHTGYGTGGGVYNSGTLAATNCIVLGNLSMSSGGGFFSTGDLILSRCILSTNHSYYVNGGGIAAYDGSAVVTGCSILGNSSGGPSSVGGGIWNAGLLSVTSTTLSGNWVSIDGCGAPGGGIFNQVTATLVNATVSGNLAYNDGWGAGIMNRGTLTLVSASVCSNKCIGSFTCGLHGQGGGIYNQGILNCFNSIVAGNSASNAPDINGPMSSSGFNLVQNTNGCVITGNIEGNLLGVDPLLGPLQDNGGPTWTHALLPGSPAIDQGSSGGLITDQRGEPRPYDMPNIPNAADGSDMGAYECSLPSILRQPMGFIVNFADTVSFNVMATGDGPLTFQWRLNGTNLLDDLRVSGATTASLTISNVLLTDAGLYSVVVSNPWGSVTSAEAALAVTGYPSAFLFTETAGGGEVHANPLYAPYPQNTQVTLTAVPAFDWVFLTWLNDARGTNAETTIVMNENKCVRAVFGARIMTTVTGAGSILINPDTDLYPYGTPVRLTALPQNGQYFAGWIDADGPTNNPRAYINNNANYAVWASFARLSGGQFALTVISDGNGRVITTPWTNQYVAGAVVTNIALAEPGQDFLGWGGDTNGAVIAVTNLVVTMSASRVITANFTKRPLLVLDPCWGGMGLDGFRLSVVGDFGARYEIQFAAELGASAVWTPQIMLTNTFGTVQFTDPAATNRPFRLYRASTPGP